MPTGLPSRFNHGQEGYEALCQFLNIHTTEQKQGIVGNPLFKRFLKEIGKRKSGASAAKKLRTAERLQQRLVNGFSDPGLRRALWLAQPENSASPHNVALGPSLEHIALADYVDSLEDAKPDIERLATCDGFYSPHQLEDDDFKIVLSLLPHIKDEFERWSTLTEKRQSDVLLAGFSIATVLDDARLLHWAAALDDAISDEYEFIRDSDTNADVNEESSDSSLTDLLKDLRFRAQALRDVTDDFVTGNITEDHFESLRDQFQGIINLRDDFLALSENEDFEKIHADIQSVLKETGEAHTGFGYEIASISRAWQEAYPVAISTDIKALRDDYQRLTENLDELLAKVKTARLQSLEALERVEEFVKTLPLKPARHETEHRLELEKNKGEAERALFDLEGEILAKLRPSSNLKEEGSLQSRSEDSANPNATKDVDFQDDDQTLDTTESLGGNSQGYEPTGESSKQKSPTKEASEEGSVKDSDDLEELIDEDSPDAPSIAFADEQDSPEDKQLDESQSNTSITQKVAVTEKTLTLAQRSMWQALFDGQFGLAYHIAHYRELVGEVPNQPPPDLLAALPLSRLLNGPFDKLGIAFAEHADALMTEMNLSVEDPDMADALNLLLLAVALRPAIFAAQHGSSVWMLQQVKLSGRLTVVNQFAHELAQHTEKLQNVSFDVSSLRAFLDQSNWQERFDEYKESVKIWRDDAQSNSRSSRLSRDIWRGWFEQDRILDELTHLLMRADSRGRKRVTEILDSLGNPKSRLNLINNDAKSVLGRRFVEIDKQVLKQLERNIDDACARATEWLQLLATKPDASGFVEQTATGLRVAIERYTPKVLASFEQLASTVLDTPLAAALKCVKESVTSLSTLFSEDRGVVLADALVPADVQLLTDDLLFVTELVLDEDGRIVQPDDAADVLALLIDRESHKNTYEDAFNARLSTSDLLGASAICDLMRDEDGKKKESLRAQLDSVIYKTRTGLRDLLYEQTDRLDQAYVARQIDEKTRSKVTEAIDGAMRSLPDDEGILTVGRKVDDIKAMIEAPFARSFESIKRDLQHFLPLKDDREDSLLNEAVEANDLRTLQEHLYCLSNNQPLLSPRTKSREALNEFLLVADQIESELKDPNKPLPIDFIDAAQSRKDYLGLSFSALSIEQAKHAFELLEVWYELAREREVDEARLRQFFSKLGFSCDQNGCEVTSPSTATLQTEPLRARALCPTYAFGSDANGHYHVVINFNSPARESIVQRVSGGDPNSHTIVLHFGKLSRREREGLRDWSIDHPTQFITIDESLVLYLASLEDGVLQTLFECTLPYTNTPAYFTSPGLVPPESFFGRESERNTILDKYGSCFVYGGRQLGKTALLHAARDTFHDPSKNHLVAFIDLKYEDVGIAHEPEHIWRVLWGIFVRLKIIAEHVAMPKGRDRMVEEMDNSLSLWIGSRKDARVLLLLDEADAFLAKDLEGDFRVSTRLKGMMEKNNRDFKVVLCGLHNVLRNVEQANHPLAHFGEPVCVGPLLNSGDGKQVRGDLEQARALVREPMSAVGYQFESDNLITQILLWTNYYPSLIQLLGEALLRHMRSRADAPFPGTITQDDLKVVFARDQFRDFIRTRFLLTLQLDSRYEVIAYATARELLDAEEGDLALGLSEYDLRGLARGYWPDGFDGSDREFHTLLQEMCGLGVLRQRIEDGREARYTFRNPNVLLLLGDDENINHALLKEREKPALFEASTYHAPYRPKQNERLERHGPLTFEQEANLGRGGRVALICGNAATRFENVSRFLEVRLNSRSLHHFAPSVNVDSLRKQLTVLRPEANTDVQIYFVNNGDLWNRHWLEHTEKTLREIQRGKNLRVVFQADSARLWDFIAELPREYLDSSLDFDWFDTINLQPWSRGFIRRWCNDLALNDARMPGKVEELHHLTGGWPILLERFADSGKKNWSSKVAELDSYIETNQEFLLEALGLKTPRSRFELALIVHETGTLQMKDVDALADLWNEDNDIRIEGDTLHRRVVWAVHLGMMRVTQSGLEINSLVKRIFPNETP